MLRLYVQKSEILSTLKLIKSGLHSRGKNARNIICEMTVTNDKITISVPGAVFSTECDVKGNAKIILPFFYFFDIIQKNNNSVIEIIVVEGEIAIDSLIVGAKTTFNVVEKGLRTIELPLNYTDKDLLLLKKGNYTNEELTFNNLNPIIKLAEKNLKKNILKASMILDLYGINKSELELWVNEKLDKSII